MNAKIFSLIIENLKESFNLPKYSKIFSNLNKNSVINDLPWTPARYEKFKFKILNILQLESNFQGTVEDIVNELDIKYSSRFFGEVWSPRTDSFTYTGWQLAEEVNKLNPKHVLDVGCGYNQFKQRISNLIGIDPYNNNADYQVDILDFVEDLESFDVIIALGSINFNSKEDIELRFAKCVSLLSPGGKFFLRANPGISHKNGPWIDIFPWSFEVVQEFSKRYNLKLETFKKDTNDRLYFVYLK